MVKETGNLLMAFGNTRTICEVCSKLMVKTLERSQWRRLGVFIVNYEQIIPLILGFH